MNRRRLIVVGAAALALGIAFGVYVYSETRPTEKRGSAREEFVATQETERQRPPEPENPTPWPMYSYNVARDHVSPYDHRPPYRRLWRVDGEDTLEFPASIGFGRAYVAQQHGDFFAIDAKTGKVDWRRDFRRCAASSPTLADGVVYQAYMDFANCPQGRPGATGFVIAMDADSGRQRWRFNAAPVESSPLKVGNWLYFGSWDRRVYALDARSGRRKWAFEADEEVNTSAAYSNGTVYIATDAGTLFALDARTGRQRWRAQSNSRFGSREFFYATPTVAYGRVYIGNTDGTMYAYGARSGELRWARPLGTYVYGAAAAYRRRIFVGTYSGELFALDAATGDVAWKIATPAAVHAAPTVMAGLVYYATCSTCGRIANRYVKPGPDGTYAVRARDGKQVWRFRDGKFANPVVADEERIYVTGRSFLYALEPRRARRRP